MCQIPLLALHPSAQRNTQAHDHYHGRLSSKRGKYGSTIEAQRHIMSKPGFCSSFCAVFTAFLLLPTTGLARSMALGARVFSLPWLFSPSLPSPRARCGQEERWRLGSNRRTGGYKSGHGGDQQKNENERQFARGILSRLVGEAEQDGDLHTG